MKEFVASTGLPHIAVDAATDKRGQDRIRQLGARVPCTIVGDEWADGVDLAAVARLIGAPYDPPVMLAPSELMVRYRLINASLQRLAAQIGSEAIAYKRPERDRTLACIVYHAGSVMRIFLEAYDPDLLPAGEGYLIEAYESYPPGIDSHGLIARARATLEHAEAWWRDYGFDDPLDRVEPTYWGHRTLHEIMEREVWHSAQHTRQVAMFLEDLGVKPDGPPGAAELAGLPIPDGVFG